MRRALVITSILVGIISAGSTAAQAQAKPASIGSPIVPLQPTDPGTGGGGSTGGGSTGGGGSTINYALTFSESQDLAIGVGGVSGREGPGVTTSFNTNFNAITYTSANAPTGDAYGDNFVYFYDYGGASHNVAINPTNGAAISDANPALLNTTAVSPAGVPETTIFLALNSAQNPANNFGGFTTLYSSTTENVWSVIPNQPQITPNFPFTGDSPSLAASSQYLFTGVRNSADSTLTLCATNITVANGETTCTNFPGTTQMNFNPGLAYWNGVLYIGFEEEANAHTLRMFTSTDNGQTISENTNISNDNVDQASTEPGLLATVANGVNPSALYVGFRSNDSGVHFLYKYSTDGINFTHSVDTGQQMTSEPVLVQGVGSFAPDIYLYYGFVNSNNTFSVYQDTATY
jgi:hypothetical protein